MFLINGQWQTSLNAQDRAIQFGDGCFTTARIIGGKVRFVDDHLRRLAEACKALWIAGVDWQGLADEIDNIAASQGQGVLKVIISRGNGGRGYSPSHTGLPSRLLSVSPMPEHYARWRSQGISLAASPVSLGKNPLLAGIKHLNRLEQVLIRRHLEQTGADEALVVDSDGSLVECCTANLFWRKGQRVFTPFVDQSGVNGTMRQRIIACLEHSPWSCQQVREPLSTLAQADEVIICNALMPIIPVNQAQAWHYSERSLYQFLAPFCE